MSLPDIGDPRIAAFYAIYMGVVLGSAWLGGAPERYGALTLVIMFVLQASLYSLVSSPRFGEVDSVSLTSDAVALVGFTAIALNADRLWPLFVAALQLISTLAHFARFNTDMLGFSYAQFKAMPTVLAILLVLFGALAHQWRLRKNGSDRSWVPFAQYREFRRIAENAKL